MAHAAGGPTRASCHRDRHGSLLRSRSPQHGQVIVSAVWNLTLKILFGGILSRAFDPTDYSVFQVVFGMIFTVIIALEFKRSLLIVAERRDNVVQVRTVVLIALLAIVRKLLIVDFATTDALQLFALVSAILALGVVYWLVRDRDLRERAASVKMDPATKP